MKWPAKLAGPRVALTALAALLLGAATAGLLPEELSDALRHVALLVLNPSGSN